MPLARLPAWGLASLAGLLCALAFPRWEGIYLEPLAWVGMVPLLVALERRRAPWWCCLCFAVSFQMVQVGPLMVLLGPWVGALLVNAWGVALIPASYLLLRRTLSVGWALAAWAPLAAVLEWAQATLLATNAPWWVLGASQARFNAEIQFIHTTGVWGLTLWLLLVNAIVFGMWQQRHRLSPRHALLLAVVATAPWLYGSWRLAQPLPSVAMQAGTSLRIAAVGSGLPAPGADRIPLAVQASENALRLQPDLIAWPEGVNVPGMPNMASMRRPLQQRVAQWNRPVLLVGTQFRMYGAEVPPTPFSQAIEAPYEARTGSVWLTPKQSAADPALFIPKQHLVPFQERLPGSEALPRLAALLHPLAQHGRAHWFTADGEPPMTLPRFQPATETQPITIAPLLCFDILFPATLAQRVRQGAQLVVWQTNDEDAQAGHYAYQFAQFARLRAVETGRDIVRVNTDGDHLHIDAWGRTVTKVPRNAAPTQAVFTVATRDNLTLATRAPHAFLAVCAFMGAALVAWGWRRCSRVGPANRSAVAQWHQPG